MKINLLRMNPPNFALNENVEVTIGFTMGSGEALTGDVYDGDLLVKETDLNLYIEAYTGKESGAQTIEMRFTSGEFWSAASEAAIKQATAKLAAGKSRTVTIPVGLTFWDGAAEFQSFLTDNSVTFCPYKIRLELENTDGFGTTYGHYSCTTTNWYGNVMASRSAPVIPHALTDGNGVADIFGGAYVNGESRIVLAAPVLDARDPTLTCSGTLKIGAFRMMGELVALASYDYNSAGCDTGPLDLTVAAGENALEWELSCVDSAGQSSTASGTITVSAYAAPDISALSAERYKAVTDDYSVTHYVQADDGTLVRFDLSAAVSAVNALNAWTLTIGYRIFGSAGTLTPGTPATARSGTDGASISASEITDASAGALMTSALSAANSYDIVLTLTDRLHSVVKIVTVRKAGGYANIEKFGTAIGMRSTGTQATPKLESAYPIYPYAGIKPVAAVPIVIPLTLTSKFTRYWEDSGAPTLMVYGNIATLTGIVKPTASIAGSATLYPICYIPEGYRPADYVHALCQGTGQCYWLLGVNADGEVDFSRYRSTNAWSTASTSVFLPFHITWIIP